MRSQDKTGCHYTHTYNAYSRTLLKGSTVNWEQSMQTRIQCIIRKVIHDNISKNSGPHKTVSLCYRVMWIYGFLSFKSLHMRTIKTNLKATYSFPWSIHVLFTHTVSRAMTDDYSKLKLFCPNLKFSTSFRENQVVAAVVYDTEFLRRKLFWSKHFSLKNLRRKKFLHILN